MEDGGVDPGFSSIYNLSVWVFFEDEVGRDGKVWLELGSYKLLHTVLYT